jgi:periplasmic divalent cation tolerance protein
MSALLVVTNCPDQAAAEALAAALVEERLAACVNILAPCRSVYRWQGAVETADEVPLLIKTTAARYAALEAGIRARHPYEVPEIIALPIAAGLPAYLQWLTDETQPDETGANAIPPAGKQPE